jgi:pimeloyl-ACP methyl ester carboxylesterase
MHRKTGPLAACAVALVALATACTSGSSSAKSKANTTTATSVIPAPAGLPAFYAVATPLPKAAGTLIKSEPVAVEGLHGTLLRVMYVSTAVRGEPVAVTGVIAVPNMLPPSGGFGVVSWAHGTNGMADKCAPSLNASSSIPLANTLLDQGWIVTATDYQGEGTPGLHPYIAGIAAGRDTIDIVRAARQIPAAHAGTNYVVWGHSQGGHTAMFALNIARTYAPELQLRGVVAGAPPSQFRYIYNFLKTSPFKHYLLMAAGGLNAAYGDQAPLDQVLTPEGIGLLPVLEEGCSSDIAQKLAGADFNKVTKADPFTVPAWQKILLENDPQGFTAATPIPLLMIQGGNDEQIPVASTQLLQQHLCELHQDQARWIYPGQSHAGVIGPSANDMIQWIKNRFAGLPTPDPYKPVGQPNVQITPCATP